MPQRLAGVPVLTFGPQRKKKVDASAYDTLRTKTEENNGKMRQMQGLRESRKHQLHKNCPQHLASIVFSRVWSPTSCTSTPHPSSRHKQLNSQTDNYVH